jgi:hypothetical protein
MNKTAIIILESIVGLLILGGAVLFFILPHQASPSQGGTSATSTRGVYHGEQAGLEFRYADTYNLEERADAFEGKPIKVITLIDKNVVIPDMSEGPPTISVIVVPNPENLPLDQWIQTKSISNWYLSNPKAEMGASTVGDESGLGYVYDGLYQNTAIAVAHNGKIYLFSVGTLTAEDQIKKDFFNLIDSVKFI